ncbi:hypothetical protein K2D_35670 [Planctomycetes bacterium K2D]|uniref:Uncharacterized protein n=1 Tax=Botrimarina mediterranea TaxID=2528022 RepID=A0A518KBY1_9BACT|nr:hypothetical protein Spa11_34920 [Botrimarina mediterranea]QDV79947.1 hypothetical protein K2D_35670 [Planctomycetes bacterium K2D]
MRFQSPKTSRPPLFAGPRRRRGPSLRLAATLGSLLLVIGLMARLQQPETHAALGRVLGETAPLASAEPVQAEPLVPADAFEGVRDNAPFRSGEQPAWFASLAAVRDAEPAALAARSAGVVGYVALNSQPDTYRGRVVTVSGSVMRVEATEPAKNDLGIEQLWRVTIQPTGGDVWPITVYTLEEPKPVDEPYDASAVGVFFKKLSYRWAEGIGSTPIIVAKRLETTLTAQPIAGAAPVLEAPVVEAQQPDIDFTSPHAGSIGRALLTDLGFDLSLFENVVDKQRLRGEETEAFYALLGAVDQTPPSQLARLARAGLDDYAARRLSGAKESLRDRQVARAIETEQAKSRYSVAPLFIDGAAERGELVVFDANVRRVVRVDASDSSAAAENGIDHYYELEAFTEDSQNLPIVFVVRDLPPGFPVGDAIRQPARLAGFFFKQWAYRGRTRTDEGEDRRQFAPLLVGRAPIPLAAPDASAMRPGTVLGVLGAAALAVTAFTLWRLSRHDRQYETATLSRFRNAADGPEHNFDRLGDLVDHSPPPRADTTPPAT